MDSANTPTPTTQPAVIVMGVSGCGKSTVGEHLAAAMGWPMLEGDAYHSEANIAKMHAGVPLNDDDRSGWLARLAQLLAGSTGVVLTCSSLKAKYRAQLRAARAPGQVLFVFLDLPYEAALQRVQQRAGHFFSPELVANQFATLERPQGEPGVLTVDATAPLEQIQQRIEQWLRTGHAAA